MTSEKDHRTTVANNEQRRSGRTATLYFLSSISAKVIGFFYFLLMAHWLDVGAFGLISFAATIAVLADTAADLGMGRYILREVARDQAAAGRLAGVFLPLKLLISLLIFGVAVLFLPPQFRGEQAFFVLSVYGLWLAASGVAILLEQILHARNRFGIASVARVLPGVVQMLAGVIVGLLGGGAVAFAVAAAVSSLSYLCVILVGLSHLGVRFDVSGVAARFLPSLYRAMPFAAVTTLLLLSLKVEFLVFAQVADTKAVGIYSMAARLYEAALTAPFAYSTVMTARMVQAAGQGRDAFGPLYQRTVRMAANGGVIAALIGAVITQPFISYMLPADYDASAPLLLIMLLGYPFMTLHLVNVSAMLSLAAQRRPAGLMLGLILMQLAIAKIALIFGGMTGVAAATAVFAVASFAASTVAVRQWLSDRGCFLALAPAIAAGLAAGTLYQLLDVQPTLRHVLALLVALTVMVGTTVLLDLPKEGAPD